MEEKEGSKKMFNKGVSAGPEEAEGILSKGCRHSTDRFSRCHRVLQVGSYCLATWLHNGKEENVESQDWDRKCRSVEERREGSQGADLGKKTMGEPRWWHVRKCC